MASPLRSRPPLPLLFLMLTGCAGSDAGFPSLAPRPIEKTANRPEASPTAPAPAPVNAALAARIAELRTKAAEGESAFRNQLPVAEQAVAAAGTVGSESWVVAQQTLSTLESARTPTRTALADIDALATAKLGSDTSASDQAAIAEASAAVATLDAAQAAAFSALMSRLGEP